jgi:hypoxanthine phosphoribosyltransferase
MSKNVSYILQTIFIRYDIRLQVNVVPQCRNTLQYVVSYVKFLEDFVQTKYSLQTRKKIQMCVEYETLDRIYKFENKQMKTGMNLGHKGFVTQFSTKEVLYYDDF